MILNFQRYLNHNDNISETGNLVELMENNYMKLLKNSSINFKRNYLLEEDSLLSSHALFYQEENYFPFELQSKKVIQYFLSTIQVCKFENGKLCLSDKHKLSDYLLFARKQIKDRPSLSESFKLPSTIDDRLSEYLSDKQNFLGQICCGCGFSYEDITCNDIECYSDYAWIVDGICLVYFGGSLSGLSFVNLLPFKIESENYDRNFQK